MVSIKSLVQYLPNLIRALLSGADQIKKISDELQDVRREFRQLVEELQDVKEELLELKNTLPKPPEV